MTIRTLILNSDGSPLKILPFQKSVPLVLDGKVTVLEESGKVCRSPSIIVPIPSVAVLKKYISSPRRQSIPVTTKAVLARDLYTCVFCGLKNLSTHNGTMDHLIPRAKGGKHTWENVAACCKKCNSKKMDRTPEEAGLTMRFQPFRPKGVGAWLLTLKVDPLWEPYLGEIRREDRGVFAAEDERS